MLFWNSDNSAIIQALNQMAQSLGNINIDMPRFSDTRLFQISLESESITKIIPRDDKSRRTTIAIHFDSTASKIILLHGFKSPPSLEDILNSPWSLSPGEKGYDDLDGGYEIYAYAIGGVANIKIALEYQGTNQSNNQLNNQMEIKPLFGTGANWDNSTGWAGGYESELNNLISGFKLFSFSSFDSDREYTFTINPGSLSYQAIAYPINIYLFNLDSISKALFWRIVNGQIDLGQVRTDIIPILKSGSWAARLPASGGDFILKPAHGKFCGLIDAKITGELYAKTAIFNYQQGVDTGTFTLVGP